MSKKTTAVTKAEIRRQCEQIVPKFDALLKKHGIQASIARIRFTYATKPTASKTVKKAVKATAAAIGSVSGGPPGFPCRKCLDGKTRCGRPCPA